MHRGKVERGGLVDVEVEAIVSLHLKGGLNARGRERCPRPAAVFVASLPQVTDLRQPRLGVVVFLRVEVARNPPSGMVARHGKLSQFLLNPEAHQGVLNGELIAEAEAVVVKAETDLHHRGTLLRRMIHTLHGTNGLLQGDEHLVVAIADLSLFAPDRFPSLVESAVFRVFQDKGMGEVVAPFEGEAHLGGQHDRFPSAVEGILRNAADDFEFQFKLSVGTLELDGFGMGLQEKSKSQAKEDKGKFFHIRGFFY